MVDIAKEATRLAALIGEPPVPINTEAELLEYVGYVVTTGTLRVGADSALGEIRAALEPGGWLRDLVRSLAEAQAPKRQNQRTGLAKRREQQLNARKRQGRETRAKIMREARLLVDYPKHKLAKLIATKCGVSERTVRHHLQSIKNTD
jgi:DNA-binding NarL/FixJ family response regulator